MACWCERIKLPSKVYVRFLYQPGKPEGGTKREFVREELLIVPPNTQLPLTYSHLKLNRLIVDPIMQHSAFVVLRTQAYLLLLMGGHLSVDHTKSLCSAMSTLRLSETRLSLQRSLGAELFFLLSCSSTW